MTIALTYAVIFWRLAELDPKKWCSLAVAGSPEVAAGCIGLLSKLVDVNGDVLSKMTILSGVLAICLAVVALRVSVKVGTPGGGNIDIGADRTTITTEAGQTITVPTPPSTPQDTNAKIDSPQPEDGK